MSNIKIIVFTAICTIVFGACKNSKEQNNSVPQDKQPAKTVLGNTKQCYLNVTEAAAGHNNESIRDSIIFEIEHYGDSVKGIFNWKPYEKDKKLSSFKGVLKDTIGTAIANSKAEGMEYKEELDFILKDSTVTIFYGEKVEKSNGIWSYKDKNNTSVQVLKRVDCF
ncbi:hypothetical protein [Flavobacterium rhizosphaerae]|uniref:Lipoprotein n=1 Tax=Flavobacterium rhizosphaerae TaxID=3163298 RepID=A0ABW8YV60_9FLAO